jgi:hypothetical protein
MDYREQLMSELARQLDISPSDYRLAKERFAAVKNWLKDGIYESGANPDIYLQGSFRLGTVVRPYRGDRDGDFDIDLVCELSVANAVRCSSVLKRDIGARLKENGTYRPILDVEGKRCWTLRYSSADGRPGFHLDVLPALPTVGGRGKQIDITDNTTGGYEWSVSNPKDYYYWFKRNNDITPEFDKSQRALIFERNQDLYDDFKQVPKQLVRTSLQRAIQLMKRHRDVYFTGREDKPISIIITTISARVHKDNSVMGVILDFANYVIGRHKSLLNANDHTNDGVLDVLNREWSIPNPVYQELGYADGENFADKWNEDSALPRALFEWVYRLKRDLTAVSKTGNSDELCLKTTKTVNDQTYPQLLENQIRASLVKGEGDVAALLDLIHLGIEGRADWPKVELLAELVLDGSEGSNKDVAKVNFYQIARHRNISFDDKAEADVQAVLVNNLGSASFIMCCHLLLGTVTPQMIVNCIQQAGYADVLEWPVMRLAPPKLLLPIQFQ